MNADPVAIRLAEPPVVELPIAAEVVEVGAVRRGPRFVLSDCRCRAFLVAKGEVAASCTDRCARCGATEDQGCTETEMPSAASPVPTDGQGAEGLATLSAPDPIAAAERAVVEAAITRYHEFDPRRPTKAFGIATINLATAIEELIRLRAAQGTTTEN